jgi:hypothetical protein
MPKIASVYSLTRTVVRFGVDGTGPDIVSEFVGTTLGSSTSTPCPQNCAILVKKLSGLTGRQNRGRFNLPGIDEAQVSATGVITAATVTSIQSGLNNFLTAVIGEANVTNMVILHQGIGDVPALAPTVVTNLVCDPLISTQRRRLRR